MTIAMVKNCLGVLMLLALDLFAAGAVECFVTPDPVRAGETARLVIRSTGDGAQDVPLPGRLPEVKNLTWVYGVSRSSSIHIVNGRETATFEARIPFTVTQPGAYLIPALKLSGGCSSTRPVKFTAVEPRYAAPRRSQTPGVVRRRGSGNNTRNTEPETRLTMDQIMFMTMDIPGKRHFYYLGEEIPLEINVFALAGARTQLVWPDISFDGKNAAVFHDYQDVNPKNPHFSGFATSSVERDGRRYTLYSFRTAIRPLAAGEMTFSAREDAVFWQRDNRRWNSDPFDFFFNDDDFFGGSFFSRDRRISHRMTTQPLRVEVRRPPAPPTDEQFTGLVGDWDTRVTLSPPPWRVGEPVTLTVEFRGHASPETLRTFPLELPGFRVYPPEVEKSASGASVRYVLIPTATADGKTDNVKFGPYCTFDPVTGRYVSHTFRRALAVGPGKEALPGGGTSVVVDGASAAANAGAKTPEQNPPRRAEDILYLKQGPGTALRLPLGYNAVLTGGGVILAGVLFFIFALALYLVRASRVNNPDYERKEQARRRKHALLSRLKKLPPERMAVECSGDLASFLADALGLPPGADLNECAGALEEEAPELAAMLAELSRAAWMPMENRKFTVDFRRKLLKALGRVALFAALCGASAWLCFAPALSAAEKAPFSQMPVTTEETARSAYDMGKFQAAGEFYASKLNPAHPSANLLYNLGNCLYKAGHLSRALVCYERALRLAPRDPDILENLNLVRRKLLLPEKYKVSSPGAALPYLRDALRPDEWIFLFCCGFALALASAGIWLLRSWGVLFRWTAAAALALMLIAGTAYLWQQRITYNPDFAVVTVKKGPVYTLPSAQAGKASITLRSGEEVVIVERRLDWVRIRSGAAEGWMRARDITRLWSPGNLGGN